MGRGNCSASPEPRMRCWPWFAGCAVFVWALSLRWSAVEVVCVSAEREAGSFCVTTSARGICGV